MDKLTNLYNDNFNILNENVETLCEILYGKK